MAKSLIRGVKTLNAIESRKTAYTELVELCDTMLEEAKKGLLDETAAAPLGVLCEQITAVGARLRVSHDLKTLKAAAAEFRRITRALKQLREEHRI